MAQKSNQPDESNSNTDIKPNTPVKTDLDGTITLSVFGDAYADLIATKAEPNAVAPELEIADVRTLGMIIKPEDDQWSDTVCITNPGCAVHGIHAQLSTEQSQMSAPQHSPHPYLPASVPLYPASLSMNMGATTIDIVPIITNTDLDTLQEATLTTNVDTLPDATSYSKDVSPANSQSEATAVQDVITPIPFEPPAVSLSDTTITLQEVSTELITLPEATSQTAPKLQTVALQEATNEYFALQAATTITSSTAEVLPEETSQGDKYTPTLMQLTEDNSEVRSKYYECLTPSQDELTYLHHDDIVNTKCSVKLNRLTSSDIADFTQVLTSKPDNHGDTAQDPNWPPKKCFKRSSQPRSKPSQSRIRAQNIIEENNKWRKRKDYTPMKILVLPEATKTNQVRNTTTLASDSATVTVTSKDSAKQPDIKLHKSGTESNSLSDSDTTIIYEVPPCTKPKKVVTFETVTHGIKITKKSRMYKCPVCGIKKTSIQSINEHYRRQHKKVRCNICNKQFNNPSSRNKHMYVHQSWNRFHCGQCDKEFPFKSMLDDHKGQHMMAKHFPCWWPGCKHGFTYRWDLKKTYYST